MSSTPLARSPSKTTLVSGVPYQSDINRRLRKLKFAITSPVSVVRKPQGSRQAALPTFIGLPLSFTHCRPAQLTGELGRSAYALEAAEERAASAEPSRTMHVAVLTEAGTTFRELALE